MAGYFCKIDDKHIPLHSVMWTADVPHFCGRGDCQQEGRCYEVRLEQGESVWAIRAERYAMPVALDHWQGGATAGDDDWG